MPPNAKLIYAEVAAKTNIHGFCFAGNKWFAERFGLSPDRVSDLIAALEKAKYIVIDIDPARENRDRRRIYLTPTAFVGGIGENGDTRSRQKCRDRPGENGDTPQYIENTKKRAFLSEGKDKERPRYLPMDVFARIGEWCGEDAELMQAWLNYAEMRQRIHRPIATAETVTRLCRKIDKMAKDSREYKLGVLRKSTDSSWQGVFELKPGDEGYTSESDPGGKGIKVWDE